MSITPTHPQIAGRPLSFNDAQAESIPDDFEGECTGFPERVLSFGGWVVIGPYCRRHDWHYMILREMLGQWTPEVWNTFRTWADLLLFLSIVRDLKKQFRFDWIAIALARAIYWTVRGIIGEMAAKGVL